MYRAYGLLLPHTDFSLQEAETRLRARFPDASVTRAENQFTLKVGEWDVHCRVNSGPEVLAESITYAERIAGLVDGSDIKSCTTRVEAWSDTFDPVLEHFDKYQRVVEVLRSFGGLIAIDPKEPALL